MNTAIAALGFYAGLSGLILVWISMSVGKLRLSEKISIDHGDNPRLVRAMRGQANFVENVPLILILLSILVFMSTPAWVIHILGIMLIAGRVMHAMHFMTADAPRWQRLYGFILTNLVLLGAALGAILFSILGMF